MICDVCRRESRGFGWFNAGFPVSDRRRDQIRKWFCSMHCQAICHRRKGMIDPTKHELAAMESAVPMAGAYIESLGKTDLMTFSTDEFTTLIEVIVTAYTDRLRELADSGEPPF